MQLNCGIDTVERIDVEEMLKQERVKFKDKERKMFAEINWKAILDSPVDRSLSVSNNRVVITGFENSEFIPDYEPDESTEEQNPPKRFRIQEAMEEFKTRRTLDKFNGKPRLEGALSNMIEKFCSGFV